MSGDTERIVLFQRQGQYHVGAIDSPRPFVVRRPAIVAMIHMPVQGPMGGIVGMTTTVALALLPVRAIEIEPGVTLATLREDDKAEAATRQNYLALLEAERAAESGVVLPRASRRVLS